MLPVLVNCWGKWPTTNKILMVGKSGQLLGWFGKIFWPCPLFPTPKILLVAGHFSQQMTKTANTFCGIGPVWSCLYCLLITYADGSWHSWICQIPGSSFKQYQSAARESPEYLRMLITVHKGCTLVMNALFCEIFKNQWWVKCNFVDGFLNPEKSIDCQISKYVTISVL